MKSLFEQIGGTYTQVGDYLLPDVELPEEKPIGVWGQRHFSSNQLHNTIKAGLRLRFFFIEKRKSEYSLNIR